MPWTTWNCHCPSQTSFQQTDIFGNANNNPDNLPACNCGQEKRRRYQICSDKDQTDGITCQKVGDELAKTGTCAGGFSNLFPFSFLPVWCKAMAGQNWKLWNKFNRRMALIRFGCDLISNGINKINQMLVLISVQLQDSTTTAWWVSKQNYVLTRPCQNWRFRLKNEPYFEPFWSWAIPISHTYEFTWDVSPSMTFWAISRWDFHHIPRMRSVNN